jgi:hypothetical protein
MNAVEFTAELAGSDVLHIPKEALEKLPKSGSARVIVLTDESDNDRGWQFGAYEQFLREDAPEDAIYEALK